MQARRRPALVVATGNPGKRKEIEAALVGLDVEVLGLDSLGGVALPEENGGTYAHNALIKARAVLDAAGLPVLADDSGLEVDALNGEPGVYSARFGGPGLSDRQRCRLLLERLDGVPDPQRSARFRAVLALLVPGGAVYLFEAGVEGRIARDLRGSGGFGYDPVFYPRGDDGRLLSKTMAQLAPEEKNRISHRGRALRLLRRALASGAAALDGGNCCQARN